MKFDIKRLFDGIDKRRPEIFLGTSLVGIITTAVLGIKGGQDYSKECEKAVIKKRHQPLELNEKKQIALKAYWPVAASALLTGASMIFCYKAGKDQLAAATVAYVTAEKALAVYKDEVKKAVGEHKERKIHDEAAERQANEDTVVHFDAGGKILAEGTGDILFRDEVTGRLFYSTTDKIVNEMAVINMSKSTGSEPYASLQDYFDLQGLADLRNDASNKFGWNINDGKIEAKWTPITLHTQFGPRPVFSLFYTPAPHWNYDRVDHIREMPEDY